ncbi:MAG: hypothetical protein KatS3mg119_0951 [Rhodothalassiaceae bacterium]|nr:MAG: hypothetical protein KatS3mg119_0951 [Rhodothalassiaceae bacterium]
MVRTRDSGGISRGRRAVAAALVLAGLWLAGAAATAGPAQQPPQDRPAGEASSPLLKSPLLAEAERLGLLAGQAEYCRIEADRLDDFIARAHARLATMSRKDPLAVAGARVEFNAFAALGRAEGPAEGCAAFEQAFRAAHRALQ